MTILLSAHNHTPAVSISNWLDLPHARAHSRHKQSRPPPPTAEWGTDLKKNRCAAPPWAQNSGVFDLPNTTRSLWSLQGQDDYSSQARSSYLETKRKTQRPLHTRKKKKMGCSYLLYKQGAGPKQIPKLVLKQADGQSWPSGHLNHSPSELESMVTTVLSSNTAD